MSRLTEEVTKYLKEARYLSLVTATADGRPDIRNVGAYNLDRDAIFIRTAKISNKVDQIQKNHQVALFAQEEGQVIPNLKNVTVYGTAEILEGEAAADGYKLISDRRPNLNTDEPGFVIIKVTPVKTKVLDFSKAPDNLITIQK